MSTAEDICFGLYLGNSTCSIAVNKKGHIEVLANAWGHRTTPAAVGLGDGGIITSYHCPLSVVGVLGDISCDDPESAPDCQTRIVMNGGCLHGRRGPSAGLSECAATSRGNFTMCPPQYSKEGQVSYKLRDRLYCIPRVTITASVVLKKIFLEMKDIASEHRSDEFPAMLTLPTWVSKRAVTLCEEAAVSAGFTILDVLYQPDAVCLAYYNLLDLARGQINEHILTLHLGESTANATLTRMVCGRRIHLGSSQYDMEPGRFITNNLFEYFATDLYNQFERDPRQTAQSWHNLILAAEAVKHLLSQQSEAQVEYKFLGMRSTLKMERSTMETRISSYLKGLVAPLARLLVPHDLKKDDIAKVVLSGGTCHIPRLQTLVAEAFPAATVLASSPDQVLAAEAARQAGGWMVANLPNIHEMEDYSWARPVYEAKQPITSSPPQTFGGRRFLFFWDAFFPPQTDLANKDKQE